MKRGTWILMMAMAAMACPLAALDYSDGLEAWQNGEHERAAAVLEKVAIDQPESVEVHYLLGLSLRISGRPGEAVEAFDAALALEPGHERAALNRVRALLDAGRDGEGLASSLAVVEAHPEWSEAWTERGRALLAVGELDGAEAALEKATSLDAESGRAWNMLGLVLLRGGHGPEAVLPLERARLLTPDKAWVHNNLGCAYEAAGRAAPAAAAYQRAADLGHATAPHGLARVRLSLNHNEDGEVLESRGETTLASRQSPEDE
jgi:Flp pilus assembly protein TadD